MVDICLIYAHASKATVRKLHALLSERYDVWWDEDIHYGDFRLEIERQLSTAKVVIPVWSRESRTRGNVLDEAEFARARGVPLVPIRIENVDLPLGFGSLHTVDLFEWDGDAEADGARALLRNLAKIVPPRLASPERQRNLDSGRVTLTLPAFFRSVSSHETKLDPEAAVKALRLTQAEAILVSAYDMLNDTSAEEIAAELRACQAAGAMVLLDSGNYEKHRKKDDAWKVDDLHRTMAVTPHDFAFAFDELDPPKDVDEIIRSVVQSVERDMRHSPAPVLPIVHAPSEGDARSWKLLPKIIAGVSHEIRPALIAVPERELGDGLVRRARTVYEIRRELNELGYYQPLHLLGTGNPLTIAVLAAAGADSFDGLEWCRTVADHETARLHHFDQFDLFKFQSELADSKVVSEAVASDDIAFSGKVAFHNLEFFRGWIADVQRMVQTGKIDRFLASKLPYGADALRLFEAAVPEVFG